MGSTKSNEKGTEDELLKKLIYLDSFIISKYEVTVAQFRKFVLLSGRTFDWEGRLPSWQWIDNHPMVNVTWEEARSYCKWRDGDLPSEAQWEKAARGTDGRIYPWGNDWEEGNRCASSESGKKLTRTVPVHSYSSGVSPYGVYNMIGNVYEWCLDYYSPKFYENIPVKNPINRSMSDSYVIRGGSWKTSEHLKLRAAYRYDDDEARTEIGFRVAKLS